jgi:glycerophosphoryl diester phosphodiesterase
MKIASSPHIIGHRGSGGKFTGNTRESFAWALKHHVAEIETDCRQTSDGVIVQFHDASVTDSRGQKRPVSSISYAKLKKEFPGLMTLEELIDFVDKKARLMIEIKPGVPTGPIIATVRKYLKSGWTSVDFSFASFDLPALKQVHKELPQIERIVLESWLGPRAIRRARSLNTKYISMNQQFLWWGFIRWAAMSGHKIYTYPYPRTRLPFNHRKPARWLRHGLYGIITDHPEIFR